MNKKAILDFNFWMNNIKMKNRQIKDMDYFNQKRLNAFFIPPGLNLTAKTRCGNESSKIKKNYEKLES